MLKTSLRDYIKSRKAIFQYVVIDGALGTQPDGSSVICTVTNNPRVPK